jgi:hypothetical protein
MALLRRSADPVIPADSTGGFVGLWQCRPLREDVTEILRVTSEGDKFSAAPRYEVGDVEMVVAELDAYVHILGKSGELFTNSSRLIQTVLS